MNWGVFGRRRVGVHSPVSAPPKDINLRAHSNRGFFPPSREVGPNNGNILSTLSDFSRESFEVTVSGGSTFARVKLKEIDGMAPQDVERAV